MLTHLYRLALTAVLAVLIVPLAALAADGSGFVSGLLSGLLSDQLIGSIVAGVLTLGAGLLVRLASTTIRRRNVAIAIRHAYAAVEEIARLDPAQNALDKVAAGLKAADDWMIANGWRPLSAEHEKPRAVLEFSAISGAEHAQVKALTAAQVAAHLALQSVQPGPQVPRAS